MMNIALIDDDISEIEYCKELFQKNFPQYGTLECFNDSLEGLGYLNEIRPDLLIVDMEMPKLNGLDLIKELRSPNTEFVFCTAHDQFAIEAYRNFALGFLLKPYTEADFIAVLSKAFQRLNTTTKELVSNEHKIETLEVEHKKIPIPTLGCTYFSRMMDIIRLESVDSYAKIHLSDGSIHMSSYGIKFFERILTLPLFFRTHKSHLVNLKKVSKLFTDGTLVLETGDRIPVSRRKRSDLMTLIGQF
ncbi:MAG: LytTR family DNA-binding domain-containing protein [Bacteroidota bacterium]